MDKCKALTSDVTSEVLQNEASKSSILYEILYSKRLLIEHVEVLEECLYEIENKEGYHERNYLNGVTAGAGLLLSGVMAVMGRPGFYILPVVSTSYAAMYLGKAFRSFRINRNKEYLRVLLRSIEGFENIIKKHIIFFNELQQFKTNSHVPSDGDFVSTCIQCLKDVILVVYDGIKELETEYTISHKYQLVYEPIEELCQTEYFTKDPEEFTSKNIKEFLNLFLLVQSQYLMRLGLIVATGDCDADFIKYNTRNLSPLIDEQTNNCLYNFDLIMFVASPEQENHSFKHLDKNRELPMDLLRAKSYSMTFVPKLLAVTHECVRLDALLNTLINKYDNKDPEQDDLHELVPVMNQIDSELVMCQDEFQRFFITFQKFLNLIPEEKLVEKKILEDSDEKSVERVEHDYRKVGETAFGYHDDFFALDGFEDEDDEGATKDKNSNLNQDDDQINRKIVKKTFKPVLKQLKTRIEPLANDMKEREKKVLTAKGIEVEDLNKTRDSERDSCSSLSEMSEDEELMAKKRTKKSSQKYNEMREFLEQKQQFNVFGFKPPAPVQSMVQEDVIE
ncbi:uncharacterized protein LOC134837136 [Culicoides brevitarsis]|uniref:uncharacterized protein LOC134837136 n=1 Tax=Culicoides brevitarsis TaxID=469753 RepID=UPI00307B5079